MQFVVEGANVYAYTGTRSFDAALPTVIFLHGAANDHSVWALQSRYFAHHGWNTLAVDLPGHGRSTGEALSAVSQNADWTIRAMDALDIARAALVGHSMGSLAALDAAGRYAERVTKLALLAPSVPMPVSEALLKASRANEHLAYELITEWSFSPEHQTGGNQQPGIWMTGNGLRLMERSRPGVLYTDLCACNSELIVVLPIHLGGENERIFQHHQRFVGDFADSKQIVCHGFSNWPVRKVLPASLTRRYDESAQYLALVGVSRTSLGG